MMKPGEFLEKIIGFEMTFHNWFCGRGSLKNLSVLEVHVYLFQHSLLSYEERI